MWDIRNNLGKERHYLCRDTQSSEHTQVNKEVIKRKVKKEWLVSECRKGRVISRRVYSALTKTMITVALDVAAFSFLNYIESKYTGC